MKHKFLVPLMAGLALNLLMAGASHALVINTDVLTFGVSAGGGLVDLAAPPAFPGDNGQGITLKTGPLPNDFSAPGNAWEFYSIRAGAPSAFVTGGVTNNVSHNPFTLMTVSFPTPGNETVTSFNGAHDVGGDSLIYSQVITTFTGIGFKHIHVSSDIYSNVPEGQVAHNVYFSRGIDPDQDVGLFGNFATINTIEANSVSAVGPLTNLKVSLVDLTGGAVKTISGPAGGAWATDPLILYNGGVNGFVNGGVPGYVDDSINLTWFLGDIPHGKSIEIDYDYTFSTVPVPPSLILLGSGLLGLVGFRFRRGQA